MAGTTDPEVKAVHEYLKWMSTKVLSWTDSCDTTDPEVKSTSENMKRMMFEVSSLAESFDPTVMLTQRDVERLKLKMQALLMEAKEFNCKAERLEERCQRQQSEIVAGLTKSQRKRLRKKNPKATPQMQ